eukprot:243323-Pelagomonas_calceolata.AAC.4
MESVCAAAGKTGKTGVLRAKKVQQVAEQRVRCWKRNTCSFIGKNVKIPFEQLNHVLNSNTVPQRQTP